MSDFFIYRVFKVFLGLAFLVLLMIALIFGIIKFFGAMEESKAVVLFEEPRECVSVGNFQVREIVNSKYVIAEELTSGFSGYVGSDIMTVVFIDESNEFYNNKIVTIPRGRCVRQIGVYTVTHSVRYKDKVLPIVKIME